MTHAAAITLIVYGVLLLVGGIMGYVKAQSRPSLIAGVISGLLAIGLGWGQLARCSFSAKGGAGLAVILAVMMGRRFFRTKKWMPSGMIAVLSLVVAGLELAVLFS